MTEPTTAKPGAATTAPGRPARRDNRRVTGALLVDLGENRRGTWVRQPRARYECQLCGVGEGPVTGADAVTEFTKTFRTVHSARCTALQEHA